MIKSTYNKHIKYIAKLLQKKYRDEEEKFLIFGDHLIEEALKNEKEIEIYTANDTKDGTLVSMEIMQYLSPTETPFDRVAIVEKSTEKPYTNKVLILDDVQDPTNVGALIRSAAGFGFTTVLSSFKTADYYNDKTIRATQGTLFYVNLLRRDIVAEIKELKKKGYQIITTSPSAKQELRSVQTKNKIALVVGNEGSGISKEVMALSDMDLHIQTKSIESLNVSVAGAVAMYIL